MQNTFNTFACLKVCPKYWRSWLFAVLDVSSEAQTTHHMFASLFLCMILTLKKFSDIFILFLRNNVECGKLTHANN